MDQLLPDTISHLHLLEILALKRLLGYAIEDESEFEELIIELAGLHASVCYQTAENTGTFPAWLCLTC